ncbi:Hypothetical protein HVR_LOCUS1233 [uncultured virus]|nr:Hypothetical protein HVR_LOCUS1233 [uncultured virus]
MKDPSPRDSDESQIFSDSDSDDDLLGINNNPIIIKTIPRATKNRNVVLDGCRISPTSNQINMMPTSAHKDEPISAHKDKPISTHKTKQISAHKDKPISVHKDKAISVHEDKPISAHKDKPISAHKDKPISAHKDKPISTHKTKSISTHKDKPISAHKDKPISSHKDKPISAHKDELTSAHKDEPISAHKDKQNQSMTRNLPSVKAENNHRNNSGGGVQNIPSSEFRRNSNRQPENSELTMYEQRGNNFDQEESQKGFSSKSMRLPPGLDIKHDFADEQSEEGWIFCGKNRTKRNTATSDGMRRNKPQTILTDVSFRKTNPKWTHQNSTARSSIATKSNLIRFKADSPNSAQSTFEIKPSSIHRGIKDTIADPSDLTTTSGLFIDENKQSSDSPLNLTMKSNSARLKVDSSNSDRSTGVSLIPQRIYDPTRSYNNEVQDSLKELIPEEIKFSSVEGTRLPFHLVPITRNITVGLNREDSLSGGWNNILSDPNLAAGRRTISNNQNGSDSHADETFDRPQMIPITDKSSTIENITDNHEKDRVSDLVHTELDSSESSSIPTKNLSEIDYNLVPTMEIIDMSSFKVEHKLEKPNKYQRMREIKNVTGFIVNVHDATNFDIDLEIPPELHEKYRDVISNQYTYQDLGMDFLENPDLNRLKIKPVVGTTYRCRLKGVGINQLPTSDHTYKSNMMCVEVKQLIDRTDGWVTCTLSDIDVYQRLLVDIVIYTGNGIVNLRDHLLDRMKSEDTPIFYPYSGKRNFYGQSPFEFQNERGSCRTFGINQLDSSASTQNKNGNRSYSQNNGHMLIKPSKGSRILPMC